MQELIDDTGAQALPTPPPLGPSEEFRDETTTIPNNLTDTFPSFDLLKEGMPGTTKNNDNDTNVPKDGGVTKKR